MASSPSITSSSSSSSYYRFGFLLPLAIYIGVIWVYSGSFTVPFIFDDLSSIPQNQHIRRLWPLSESMTAPLGSTVTGRPLVSFTLALNYQISGLNPWSYHLFNLLIHLFNLTLVSWLVQRTWNLYHHRRPPTRRPPTFSTASLAYSSDSPLGWYLGWIVAFLWAVHPLNTEAVVYVIQRTELLVSFFLLLTLVCANQGWQCQSIEMGQDSSDPDAVSSADSDTSSADTVSSPRDSNQSWVWYSLSVFSCVLGMLTKEVMAVTVILVYLYDAVFASQSFTGAWRRHKKLYIPLACTWSILAWITWQNPRDRAIGFTWGVTILDSLRTNSLILWRYLANIFYPVYLSIVHDVDVQKQWTPAVLIASVTILFLLLFTTWGLIKKQAWSFCAVAFFLILAPTSSFIPIVTEWMADRRLYLPSLAILLLPVSALACLLSRVYQLEVQHLITGSDQMTPCHSWQTKTVRLTTVGILILVLLSGLVSKNRIADYQTSITLWEDAARLYPHSAIIQNGLGNEYEVAGMADQARQAYQQAVDLNPNYHEGYYNLGRWHLVHRQFAAARFCFEKTISLLPTHHSAYLGLVRVALLQRDLSAVRNHLQQAWNLVKDDPNIELVWALVCMAENNDDQALQSLSHVLSVQPDNTEALLIAMQLLAEQGRLQEALFLHAQLFATEADSWQAGYQKGIIYWRSQHFSDAVVQFQHVLELQPQMQSAFIRLAHCLAMMPDTSIPQVQQIHNRLSQIVYTSDGTSSSAFDWPAYDALAMLSARLGNFSQAISFGQQALLAAQAEGRQKTINLLNQKLTVYQNHQPYFPSPSTQPASH